jgi:16S rRNA (guanine527-N7)-methyltransferase
MPRSRKSFISQPALPVLDESTLRQLLEPFGLSLSNHQSGQLIAYLELLLRWNQKINLTALPDSHSCVRRHFGESLYLGRWVELKGKLLDIGSGAGFPGLCLKIIFPELQVTLLEPVAKKRAFLKEVARVCGMKWVEVRRERLADFAGAGVAPLFDAVTARAVGHLEELIPLAGRCLKEGGDLFLWLSRRQTINLGYSWTEIRAVRSLVMPDAGQGEIWWGKLASSLTGGM